MPRRRSKSRESAPQPTRRQTLQQFGIALLAGGVWTQTSARSANSANDKLNLAAIGVANRGEANLIGVHDENIAAICDVDEDYLDQRSQRYPRAKTFFDYRRMLDLPGLDGVVISSPDHTHAHAALSAIRRGLHVYCEKPLATTIRETRAMVALAGEKKVATQTGTQHHSTAGYRRVAEIVRSGGIGEVRAVHVWTNRPFWPQGITHSPAGEPVPPHLHWDEWLGPSPDRPYSTGYHPMNWRGYWDFGTGALGDRGPHLLDPVFHALQLTAPTSIQATSSPVTDESPPEWSTITFEFPGRQEAPPVRLHWYDGGKQPALEVAGVERQLPDNGALLLGSLARMFVPELGGTPLVIANTRGADLPPVTVKLPSTTGHYREWIEACKGRGTTSCDFAYGARLTETCLLGNVALRAGGPIRWDAASGRIVDRSGIEHYLTREYRRGWEL